MTPDEFLSALTEFDIQLSDKQIKPTSISFNIDLALRFDEHKYNHIKSKKANRNQFIIANKKISRKPLRFPGSIYYSEIFTRLRGNLSFNNLDNLLVINNNHTMLITRDTLLQLIRVRW